MRYDLTRGNPNELAVHRLNHSATSSWNLRYFLSLFVFKKYLYLCKSWMTTKLGAQNFVALWQANLFFSSIQTHTCKKRWSNSKFLTEELITTRMRFELTRGNPNGLAVHRLNHSATSSWNRPKFLSLLVFKKCLYLCKSWMTPKLEAETLWPCDMLTFFFSSIQTQTCKKRWSIPNF